MSLRILIFCLWIFSIGLISEEPKSIGIVTMMSNNWDPDSIKSGITGSEEAVIYMADSLAKQGYKVTVLGCPPKNSPYSKESANPRYVSLNSLDLYHFDIAISWRMPEAAAHLKKFASRVYLWPHDTNHTLFTDEEILGFSDVLWLSQWQRQQWISINPTCAKFTHIFGNGINVNQFNDPQERENPYSCIYGSNYARGLEILLDLWPAIKHQYPRATLDIYYGWNSWGKLSVEQEEKMQDQVDRMYKLGVLEHGLVGHEELNRAYEKASLWTYPCIVDETFCITGLRAQMAGAVPVIIRGSALTETVQFGYSCVTPEEYLKTILKAMGEAERISLKERQTMGDFIKKEYTWDALALKWKALFDKQANL